MALRAPRRGNRAAWPRWEYNPGSIERRPGCGLAELQEDYVAEDTYTGSFYCVKCKDHREAQGEVVVNAKGTRIAKAKCPVCSTNLTRFLPKA